MKKKLLAVILTSAVQVPMAAHAQTANVTLYGRLNGDLEIIRGKQAPDASGNQSNPWVSRLSSNVSRFGIRGVESLGGGLNAIFQLESHVQFDTGNSPTSGFASRESFVGLQGGWGTFKAGKFVMPEDDISIVFGNVPTLLTSILSPSGIWANGAQTKFNGGFDDRLGNSLRYDSPVWAGFVFEAQVALRDSSGFTDNVGPSANTANPIVGGSNGDHAAELRHAYVIGGAGFYNNGPLTLAAGFETNNKVRNYAVTGGQLYANDWEFSVTGAYNFGLVRPALVYERIKYETPTGDVKREFFGISLTAPLGPGIGYAYFAQATDGKGSAMDGTRIGSITKGPDTGARQYTVTYTYPFSNRTAVYAGWVKIDNKRNAAYSFAANPYAVNATCTVSQPTCSENGKPEGLVFGMFHLF
jgi:predicted porin